MVHLRNYLIVYLNDIKYLPIAYPEHSHEKCISKSDANDISLSCESNERIAIFEAFFTTSFKHRCTQSLSDTTEGVDQLTVEDKDFYYRFPPPSKPCTDDIRLSLNRR